MWITGGYTQKWAKGTSSSFTVNLKSGEWGYFPFVAICRETCGTSTDSHAGFFGCDKSTKAASGNSCIEQVARFNNDDGYDDDVARGIVILVYTDCITLEPLLGDKQDPSYSQPEVKLPWGDMVAYQQFWKEIMSNFLSAAARTCSPDTEGVASDCLQNIGLLLQQPTMKASVPKKEKLRCSLVWVNYLEDIGDACPGINYMEVAAAVQGIYDHCQGGQGNMGVRHAIGTKCAGAVIIKRD